MSKKPEINSLNALDLDIEELERRLELATVITPDSWCSCDSKTCDCYGYTCNTLTCSCLDYSPCTCDGAYLPIELP